MDDPISDDIARIIRKLWFDYLDCVAPIRSHLDVLRTIRHERK